MFDKDRLEALFAELDQDWRGSADFDRLTRDAHLGIALSDAGRSLEDRVDARVIALIDKHRP